MTTIRRSVLLSLALVAVAGLFVSSAPAQDAGGKDPGSKDSGSKAAVAAPTGLRVRLAAGNTWEYRYTLHASATCPELDIVDEIKVERGFTLRVVSTGKDDGSHAIELVFGPAAGSFRLETGEVTAFDTAKAAPTFEDLSDTLSFVQLTQFHGCTIQATVDALGRVQTVDGVKEAFAASLAGTPVAAMAEELPDDDACSMIQMYLPALPEAQEVVTGATWDERAAFEFGGGLEFKFDHAWNVRSDDSAGVTLTAALVHEPGEDVPDGQANSGKGVVVETRSSKDGLITSRLLKAVFTGTGNFTVDAVREERLERVVPEPVADGDDGSSDK